MNTPAAYERLIGACIRGERSWFSQWDQIETSWKYVDAIREQYHRSGLPVHLYPQGSAGPKAADKLLGDHGHVWFE